jgi:hypothetical protein
MIRSLLAVLVGYAVLAAVVFLLPSLWLGGAQPAEPLTRNFLFLTLGAGLVAAVAGGWVTVLIAPGHRWKHIQGLAAVVLLVAAVNLLWSAGQGPLWFELGKIGLQVAGVFVGGSLKRGLRL